LAPGGRPRIFQGHPDPFRRPVPMTDHPISRRAWFAGAAAAVAAVASGTPVALAAPAGTAMTVYKDPNCGCCAKWIEHVKAAGFAPTVKDTGDMDAVKTRHMIPTALRSCHTALVGDYVVEGHVPAADIRRLLKERPAVRGLAVGGMPAGSPGMEMPGARADKYDVVAFLRDGSTRAFAHH
jgi:hypothetical protein